MDEIPTERLSYIKRAERIEELQSRIKELEQQNEAMKKELLENEEVVAEWQRYSHDLLSKLEAYEQESA